MNNSNNLSEEALKLLGHLYELSKDKDKDKGITTKEAMEYVGVKDNSVLGQLVSNNLIEWDSKSVGCVKINPTGKGYYKAMLDNKEQLRKDEEYKNAMLAQSCLSNKIAQKNYRLSRIAIFVSILSFIVAVSVAIFK